MSISSNSNNDPHFYYVVHTPIFDLEGEETVKKADQIFQMCGQLSSEHRVFRVVIGFNAKHKKNGKEAKEKSGEAILTFLDNAVKACGRNISIEVLEFDWKDYKKDGTVNYVDIRNQLFYNETNLTIIASTIEEASKQSFAFVKLLSLDPDSTLDEHKITDLEQYWAKQKVSALITSGIYRFDISDKDKQLISQDSASVNWKGYLAKFENDFDVKAKDAIASEKFSYRLHYQTVDTSHVSAEISQIKKLNKTCEENIAFLKKQFEYNLKDEESAFFKSLLAEYKHLRKETVYLLKYAAIDDNMLSLARDYISNINYIIKTEPRSRTFLSQKTEKEFSGEDILYPTEAIIFISLFKKSTSCLINLFELYSTGDRKLWGAYGKGNGSASEGQKLAVSVRDTYKKSHDAEPEKLVEFPWIFTTTAPERCVEIGAQLLVFLPSTVPELKDVLNDGEKTKILVETCVATMKKSQSFFSKAFLPQRLSYIEGEGRRESVIPKFYRDSLVQSFKVFYLDLKRSMMKKAREKLRDNLTATRQTLDTKIYKQIPLKPFNGPAMQNRSGVHSYSNGNSSPNSNGNMPAQRFTSNSTSSLPYMASTQNGFGGQAVPYSNGGHSQNGTNGHAPPQKLASNSTGSLPQAKSSQNGFGGSVPHSNGVHAQNGTNGKLPIRSSSTSAASLSFSHSNPQNGTRKYSNGSSNSNGSNGFANGKSKKKKDPTQFYKNFTN